MATLSQKARIRIEAQGFLGYGDPYLADIQFWLRLSPAICLIWTAFGVAMASPMILIALVPFALGGVVLRNHPFDVIYNRGIRHITGNPRLPRYGRPRRFACLMAAVMISAVAAGFQFDYTKTSYAVGTVMIVMASTNVTTGFCVPSLIYRVLFGSPLCVSQRTTHPSLRSGLREK